MKLLFCRECQDVLGLLATERACACGKSKGRYVDDLNAVISGPCTPLGFANPSFVWALSCAAQERPRGMRFEAFVIPLNAKSVRRMD